MRQEFKEEAVAIVERLARLAVRSEMICVAREGRLLMGTFWDLISAVAADLAREERPE